MKKVIAFCIVAAILLGSLMGIISCNTEVVYVTPTPKTIDYQVLRQWSTPAGGIGMEILVSEDAAKEDVLALANSLRSKYLSRGYIFIDIFDSLEAYTHRDDMTYPEAEYWKHYLVNIVRNPQTGYDEIYWAAEGRDH